MTLIAAFLDEGCPVFLGDLIVSGPGTKSLTSLPMWQRPDLDVPVNGGYRLTGLTSKVVIVSDRLCVAWTGPVYRADALLRYLREAEAAQPTGNLHHLFASYPRSDYGDLEMAAIGQEDGGFRWFTSPAMVMMQYGPFTQFCVGGSGTPALLQTLDVVRWINREATSNVYDQLLARVLTVGGQLMAKQVYSGQGLQEGWGGGFEVVYYDHHRSCFTKMDNILYLLWGFTEIAPSQYSLALLDPFVFQWTIGEETVFWHDIPGKVNVHAVGPSWLRGTPFPISIPPPPMQFAPKFVLSFCRRSDQDGTGAVGCLLRSSSEGPLATIQTGVETPNGPKTNIAFGNSLPVEVAEDFLPPDARVVEYSAYGAQLPWPPIGFFHLNDDPA